MKNFSIWLDDLNYKASLSLDKDIETDVLIIGGGITGLSTLHHLRNSNLKVCLVEKNLIGHGVTGKTTGKLTYLQELIYSDLSKLYDTSTAKTYLESQIDAVNLVKKIIKDNNIDCSFEEVDSYIFTLNNKDIKKIKLEKKILESFGIKVNDIYTLPDKTNVNYGVSVSNTAVFHPLKYLISLKKLLEKQDVKIYENTKIIDIKKENDFICKTNSNTIKAKKVILALHYPYFLIPYLFPFKTHLEKSYITAFKVKENNKFSAITAKKPTLSLRYLTINKNKYKIILSNSHNIAFKNNDFKNFSELTNLIDNPDYVWSNKDIITFDKMPLIGSIADNLYLATGYNTWGMTNASLAGKIISDQILNIENKYSKIFNPKRILKDKMINFPITIFSNTKSFIGSKINKNKFWYKDNVIFENGLGIYIDDNGKKHIVYNKCPHLKCSLIFNEVEKTWDCPCHGSRFDIDGNSIEGPSNFNITYKN